MNEKTKRIEKNIQELETGLTSTNTDVTDMEGRQKQTLEKIKSLEDKILYQDVYSRRENSDSLGCQKLPKTLRTQVKLYISFLKMN